MPEYAVNAISTPTVTPHCPPFIIHETPTTYINDVVIVDIRSTIGPIAKFFKITCLIYAFLYDILKSLNISIFFSSLTNACVTLIPFMLSAM